MTVLREKKEEVLPLDLEMKKKGSVDPESILASPDGFRAMLFQMYPGRRN